MPRTASWEERLIETLLDRKIVQQMDLPLMMNQEVTLLRMSVGG